MILDRTWNKKEQKLTISYIDKQGNRQFYQKYFDQRFAVECADRHIQREQFRPRDVDTLFRWERLWHRMYAWAHQ
jgi:hypothetical protein